MTRGVSERPLYFFRNVIKGITNYLAFLSVALLVELWIHFMLPFLRVNKIACENMYCLAYKCEINRLAAILILNILIW